MSFIRQPSRSIVTRIIARTLIAALVVTLVPIDAHASRSQLDQEPHLSLPSPVPRLPSLASEQIAAALVVVYWAAISRPKVVLCVTIHADGIGSVRALTEESGAITDTYTYTAFGELIEHVGADSQPYAFTGEPLDPNVGFQYHRARWMDPRTGRWASMDVWRGGSDPIWLHKYVYAHNNALTEKDPSGLMTVGAALTVVAMTLIILAIATPVNRSIASGRCGPDITDKLKLVVQVIRADFHADPAERKRAKCRSLYFLSTFNIAWDIAELAPGFRNTPGFRGTWDSYCSDCPTSGCMGTVTVDSQCHYSDAVNYVMWGTITSLCGLGLDWALRLMTWRRETFYGGAKVDEMRDWTIAGYNGWPQSGRVPSTHRSLSQCSVEGVCTVTRGVFGSDWSYYWLTAN